MRCTSCDFESAAGMKFCGRCGTPLAAPCPSCGFENPDGFSFCGACGAQLESAGLPRATGGESPVTANARAPRDYTPKHLADKILRSKSALEGERKQVTVLFADVKGSMELAEQVDPEEWHRDPRPLLRDPDRRRAPLRGHGQPVHRRRHHGALRRADRARGPRAARLLRGAAPARRAARATPTS